MIGFYKPIESHRPVSGVSYRCDREFVIGEINL
jgi:hypothetical protein